MRILVLSDSHGDIFSMRTAIQTSPADAVIFLGDGLRDWEEVFSSIRTRKTAAVRGNCDFYTADFYPTRTIEELNGIRCYCTHGYMENVKYGLDPLKQCARDAGATIALFGHTHNPHSEYDDGLYMLNPGSVRQNSCGIIDITPGGILCFTKKIVPET